MKTQQLQNCVILTLAEYRQSFAHICNEDSASVCSTIVLMIITSFYFILLLFFYEEKIKSVLTWTWIKIRLLLYLLSHLKD